MSISGFPLFQWRARATVCVALVLAVLFATPSAATENGGVVPVNLEASGGAEFILDGTGSINHAPGELEYCWRQVSGPAVVLSDYRSPMPRFRPDVSGFYAFELVVSSEGVRSEPCVIALNIAGIPPRPPVAQVRVAVGGQEVRGATSPRKQHRRVAKAPPPAPPQIALPGPVNGEANEPAMRRVPLLLGFAEK